MALVAVVLAVIAAGAEASKGRKLLQGTTNYTGSICAFEGDICTASSGFLAASPWKPEGRLATAYQRYHHVAAGCSLGSATAAACKTAGTKLEKKLGSRFTCAFNEKAKTCDMDPELKADFGKTTTQWWLAACPGTPLEADIKCWFNTNDTKSCAAAGPNCAWVAKDAPSKAGKGRPAGCYSKARASSTPEEFEAFLAKANAFDASVVGTCDSMKALKTGTTTAKACSALTKKAECAAKADCAWSGSACAMSQTAMGTLVGLPADLLSKVKACAAKATSADCAAVGSFSVALAA
jgi:hypothetical protein